MTKIPDKVPTANATHSNGWLAVMSGDRRSYRAPMSSRARWSRFSHCWRRLGRGADRAWNCSQQDQKSFSAFVSGRPGLVGPPPAAGGGGVPDTKKPGERSSPGF
jgi:hypothetical protein